MSHEAALSFVVNGRKVTRTGGVHLSLLRWLRDLAGVTDPKYGCGEGVCGACTVLVDGKPVSSCIVLAAQVEGAAIVTASGLCESDGALSVLQRAFYECHAAQCGFCTPGMIVAASALLAAGGRPSRGEIRQALHGNLCRCTGYGPILDAVERALDEGAHDEGVREAAPAKGRGA